MAPVDVQVIYPPLRNLVEQEMLEDRRAANRDKEHRALYGTHSPKVPSRVTCTVKVRSAVAYTVNGTRSL